MSMYVPYRQWRDLTQRVGSVDAHNTGVSQLFLSQKNIGRLHNPAEFRLGQFEPRLEIVDIFQQVFHGPDRINLRVAAVDRGQHTAARPDGRAFKTASVFFPLLERA